MLDAGARLDVMSPDDLYFYFRGINEEAYRLVIESGWDVNAHTSTGASFLSTVVSQRGISKDNVSKEFFQFLLEKGADPNYGDSNNPPVAKAIFEEYLTDLAHVLFSHAKFLPKLHTELGSVPKDNSRVFRKWSNFRTGGIIFQEGRSLCAVDQIWLQRYFVKISPTGKDKF